MDIENKKAWAAGMGVCEIIYRGQDLSDICAIKAAKNLIERFFNSCQDANLIANNWIDSPDVNIRENNNYDHVIDYICERMPRYDLTVNEYGNPKPEVEQNLEINRVKDEDVNKKINALTSRVRTELKKLIHEHINQECGVSTVENVLEAIGDQVDIFLDEMTKEKEDFLAKEPMFQSSLDTACADLSEYDKKILKNRNKLDDKANDVSDACRALATCRQEILRRTAAITVFNNIKGILAESNRKVSIIAESLKAVNRDLTTKLARIQNNVGRAPAIFQIDLAQNSMNSVSVVADEIQIPEFVKGLRMDNKVFGFADLSNDEIEELILKYTKRLHSSRNWRETGIDDVLDKMSQEEFDHVVRVAIEKSMPLFRYDYRGYMPKERPQNSFFIGVPFKQRNRLYKNDYFKGKLTGTMDVDFASIGVNDRVIIYRQVGVVPAYTIADLPEYRKEYEQCRVNCHYDFNLETRMRREDFSLRPKKATDEDLLDLWVKGFIFGLVKNENGEYYFKSQEQGDALDDFWVKLGEYRDEAFDTFRTYRSSVRKEFNEFFDNLAVSKGATAIKSVIDDVKENYYEKYSQIKMTKEEVKKKGFEKIRELITAELTHIKKL